MRTTWFLACLMHSMSRKMNGPESWSLKWFWKKPFVGWNYPLQSFNWMEAGLVKVHASLQFVKILNLRVSSSGLWCKESKAPRMEYEYGYVQSKWAYCHLWKLWSSENRMSLLVRADNKQPLCLSGASFPEICFQLKHLTDEKQDKHLLTATTNEWSFWSPHLPNRIKVTTNQTNSVKLWKIWSFSCCCLKISTVLWICSNQV